MLNTPHKCPIFGRSMICQDMQYHLVKFTDCLSPLNSKSKEPTCPIATCNTDSYISTPAGLLLRTSEPIVTVASKKSKTSRKTHPHLQTTSSVTELKVPSYQVKFIRWTTNVTSVAFGKMIINSLPMRTLKASSTSNLSCQPQIFT